MEDEFTPADEPVVGEAPPTARVWLSNRVYDRVQFLAQVFLPGLGTLYFALAPLWGLPKAEEVVGTIVAVDAFLGLLLGASKLQYRNSDARFDGQILLSPGEDPDTTDLRVQLDPIAVDQKDEVTVKVKRV